MHALNDMVDEQISRRGVRDLGVLGAMRRVPRQRFVPLELKSRAFEDRALPIGEGQTISQPYIVGSMTELLKVEKGCRVLEVGTGSGYQTAVLAELGADIYTIEIVPKLAKDARRLLGELGYRGIHFRTGDGFWGWPDAAPFDRILIAAAPRDVPQPLLEQIADRGRMVLPVGGLGDQNLRVIKKRGCEFRAYWASVVRFVPMTGQAQNLSEGA